MIEIPGYTIQRVLGQGGMATVYLAVQDRFEREVALKVMTPALATDPSFRERFLREARIVGRISHPNIVVVHDVNEANGFYYLAMEFHPGGDLKEKIRNGMGILEVLRTTKDIARALDFAHAKGYLHRDIKPDNILFRADGSAVLTDFGIAKAAGNTNLTQAGVIAGTAGYMSPEQAQGQPLGPASDLYALGVVLVEMLTGQLPYGSTDAVAVALMHLNAPIPRLQGRVAHFQPLIDRLLAKAAAQRPQRGLEAIQAVEMLEASFDFAAAGAEAGAMETGAVDSKTAQTKVTNTGPTDKTGLRARFEADPITAQRNTVPQEPAQPPRRHAAIGIALLVLLAAGAGGALWYRQSLRAALPHPAPVTTLAAVITAAASPAASAPAAALATSAPAPSSTTPEVLLNSATLALARGNLLTPPGQSALDLYRAVLAQDPHNAAAMAGLQRLCNTLRDQALAALGKGDIAGARKIAAELPSVDPTYAGLRDLQQAIAKAKAQQPESDDSATPDDAAAPDTADMSPPASPATPATAPASTPTAKPTNPGDNTGNSASNNNSNDNDDSDNTADQMQSLRIQGMLGSAEAALDSGHPVAAIARYRQVLQLDPDNADAKLGLQRAQAAAH